MTPKHPKRPPLPLESYFARIPGREPTRGEPVPEHRALRRRGPVLPRRARRRGSDRAPAQPEALAGGRRGGAVWPRFPLPLGERSADRSRAVTLIT